MITKNAVFFVPPFPSRFDGISTGMLEAATACAARDIECKVVDLGAYCNQEPQPPHEWQACVQRHLQGLDDSSTFCGITVTSPAAVEALALARFLRDRLPKAIIGVGGAHIQRHKTFLDDQRTRAIDWAFHAGELSRDQFADAVVLRNPPAQVPDVSFRTEDSIVHSLPHVQVGRSDGARGIPPVRLNLLESRLTYSYLQPKLADLAVQGRTAQAYTATGCKLGCRFCSSAESSVSLFSIPEVERHLEGLMDQGIEYLFFDDPTFTLKRRRTRDLLKVLTGLRIRWGCQTRADRVDPELLNEMHGAGCNYIFYGIESGSDAVKQFLRKKISNDCVREAVQATLEVGIETAVSVIFGVPNETSQDVDETLGLIESLARPVRISPSFYAVYPGTQAERDLWDRGETLDYLSGYSRDNVWLNYDDGYGGCHVFDSAYAEVILRKLNDVILRSNGLSLMC